MMMPGFRQHFLVALPEVAVEQHPVAVGLRHTLPQQTAAGRLAPVADRVSDHLASAPAQRKPNPPFVLALAHERPQLIEQLQDLPSFRGRSQRSLQRRQAASFF